MSTRPYELTTTYVQLKDDGSAVTIPVTPDFWAHVEQYGDGRLLTAFRFDADWTSWEMHPEGDEIVYLLSGAMDLVLDTPGGEQVIALRGRGGVVIPRGTWHTARVHEPTEIFAITAGRGTRHRPI
jgi:mannose-6-phosphate isomerase-like protein (cupin superfamily)